MTRMKIPPLIAQFKGLDRTQTLNLFKLLKKYSPEDEKQKAKRLLDAAAAKKSGTKTDDKKPTVLKFGLQHVTRLVEEKKAKIVIIAADVDPIELVLWLPQLCRKMDVPYAFVKSKANLGQLVHQKTATCVALVDYRKEDASEVDSLSKIYKTNFNDNEALRKEVGGNKLGFKSQKRVDQVIAQKEKESIRKAKA